MARAGASLKSIVTREWAVLAPILLVGCALRTVHLACLPIDFPNKGGGLYLEFAEQIADHGFRLPATIPFYTEGGIPFAYPPLAFYVEAVLMRVFSLSGFVVANALPPVVAILALFAFNGLTRALELSLPARAVALLAYATMDSAFLEQIAPAGLAEAFGSLSVVGLGATMLRAYRRGTAASHVLVGLVSAVAVVSSPGSAYAAVATGLLFASVQLVRSERASRLRALSLLALTGAVALVVSSPYWLSVARNHGVQIFTASFAAQHGRLLSLESFERLTEFQIAGDAFVWNVLLLAGIVWGILCRRWPLVVWFLLMYTIPREGAWLVATPAALLAGCGAVEMVAQPLIGGAGQLGRRLEATVLAVLAVPMIMGPAAIGIVKRVRYSYLPTEAVTVMNWAEENTQRQSRFLVLVSNPVIEWAPHLMQRTVLNVRYGTEFVPEERGNISRLNRYLGSCEDFACAYESLFSSRAISESLRPWFDANGVYLLASKESLAQFQTSPSETTFATVLDEGQVALGLLMPPGFGYLVALDAGCGLIDSGAIPTSLRQGEVLELQLEWACSVLPRDGLSAQMTLVDASEVAQWSIEADILPESTVEEAWTGAVVTSRHSMQVGPHWPPGQYTLEIGFLGSGESGTLAQVQVTALPRVFDPPADMERTVEAQFGNAIRLLGYDLARENDGLALTLHWQAIERPAGYYKVFVHVLDPQTGVVVAQHDAAPRDWSYPTDWWEAGEVVSDTVVVPLREVPRGAYRLAVGMYEPGGGDRLTVRGETGEPHRADRLLLPDEIVW